MTTAIATPDEPRKPRKPRKASKKPTTAVAKIEQAPAPRMSEAETFLSMMRDPNASPERLEKIFDLYERVQADAARKAWIVAFTAVSKEIEPVAKDASNPATGSKYASFYALDTALKPAYSAHGFSITHTTEASAKPHHVKVVSVLMHQSGHERRYEIDMPADGKGAKGGDVMTSTHATGSAFTYGKRYNIGGMFNISSPEVDDDGNRAGGSQPERLAADALEPITQEQCRVITQKLVEARANMDAFFKVANVQSVPAILRKDYDALVAKLDLKIAALKKGESL